MIPKQLQKNHFRFIKVGSNKVAMEKTWQKVNNYLYDEAAIQLHIKENNKYGVVCGYGNLVVIDFDKEEIQDKVLPLLPDTFMIKTAGKGLLHLYYISDDAKGFRVNDINNERVADIQGHGTYVVGANTIMDNGKKYKVVKDIDIAKINMIDIKKAFEPWLNIEREIKKTENKQRDPELKAIMDKIKVPDLLKEYDIDLTKNPTDCFSHLSIGGKCLSYTDTLWYCFHCGKKGNIFNLYMDKNNVDFITAKKELAKRVDVKLINPLERENQFDDYDSFKEHIQTLILQQKRKDVPTIIADYFICKNYVYTIRSDKDSEMWIYDEGIYIPEAKTHIKEFVKVVCGSGYTYHVAAETIAHIEALTYVDKDDFFNQEQIKKVCLKNGIYDIAEGKLEEYTPNLFFFNKIPINYDITKKCQNIITFLTQIMNKDDVPIVQEMFGYLLLKDYRFPKALMLTGVGRNGKGRLIELIKQFVGLDNCSGIDLQTLSDNDFAESHLFKKLANLAGDLSSHDLKKSGKLKNLTGEDYVTANRKNKTMISFVNYAKLIFACNELPRSNDDSEAYFSRWIIIEFPYRFYSIDEIEKMKLDGEYIDNVKVADRQIIKKITNDNEMSGLFNWALEGLKRLFENGGFSNSKSVSNIKKMYIRKSDSLRAFIMDYIIEEYNEWIPKTMFKMKYAKYCKLHKIKTFTDKIIREEITKIAEDERKSINGEQKGCWVGIKFRDDKSKGSKDSNGFSTSPYSASLGVSSNTPTTLTTLTNFEDKNPPEETIQEPENDDDTHLLNIIKDKGNEGYPTHLFEDKYGLSTLKRLLRQGDIYEPRTGFLQVLP